MMVGDIYLRDAMPSRASRNLEVIPRSHGLEHESDRRISAEP